MRAALTALTGPLFMFEGAGKPEDYQELRRQMSDASTLSGHLLYRIISFSHHTVRSQDASTRWLMYSSQM